MHTRRYGEYSVIATDAPSVRQGGLAFFWRESKLYEVEEVHKHGRNVIAAQVFNGASRFYIIGAYILPSSLTALAEVQKAWLQCPSHCTPMLVGDLNVDLESPPGDERGVAIADQVDAMDLRCMSRQFGQRRQRRVRGRWTWRMRRLGRWISSSPDYFLCRASSRKKFKNVALRQPRGSNSDHRAIVAEIYSDTPKRLKRYRRRRQQFPVRLPKVGPRTEMETQFETLRASTIKPPPRQWKSNAWISEDT